MNLKLLLDVLSLIEEKSFTVAALRRNVTQPAFSRRIQAMESWLGHPLVERSGRHVTVSKTALEAEAKIRSLVDQFQGLKRFVELSAMQKRHVIFTMPHTLSMYSFGDMVQELMADASLSGTDFNYAFSLKSEYKSECLAIFLRGDADFFICNEERGQTCIPSSFQCESTTLGVGRLIPVAQTAFWQKLCPDDKPPKAIPMIAYPEESYLWAIANKECLPKLHEAYEITTVCETALSGGVKDLVSRGIGVGWLPESYVRSELEAGKFVSLADHFGHCAMDQVCYLSQSSSENGLLDLFSQIQSLEVFGGDTARDGVVT